MAVGVFPGSFDPLTTGHLAVAEAAVAALGLERLDLVMSEVALAKEAGAHTSLAARVAAIEAAAAQRPWLRAGVTTHRLIADIAAGYDACVVGADKWHQLHDVAFYGSVDARDAALARLPQLVVAPRQGVALPPASAGLLVLAVDPGFHEVSSTAVRAGREEWRA
jgi:nicotinic acid mononucleotide adenylyltransferase